MSFRSSGCGKVFWFGMGTGIHLGRILSLLKNIWEVFELRNGSFSFIDVGVYIILS